MNQLGHFKVWGVSVQGVYVLGGKCPGVYVLGKFHGVHLLGDSVLSP